MEFASFFPIWGRLTAEQKAALSGNVFEHKVKKGDVIHSGDADCTGLILVRSGQLRTLSCLKTDARSPYTDYLNETSVCFPHPA